VVPHGTGVAVRPRLLLAHLLRGFEPLHLVERNRRQFMLREAGEMRPHAFDRTVRPDLLVRVERQRSGGDLADRRQHMEHRVRRDARQQRLLRPHRQRHRRNRPARAPGIGLGGQTVHFGKGPLKTVALDLLDAAG